MNTETNLEFSLTRVLYSLIDFYLRADTVYKIHSPYLFELLTKSMDMTKSYYADTHIEALREELANNHNSISFKDFGAKGFGNTKTVRVSKLIKTAVSNKWKCLFLRNLVLHLQPNHLIEFGTNLGLSTAYMRSAKLKAQLTTIEAAGPLSTIAQKNFERLGYSADFETMTFDDFLLQRRNKIETCDFFYLDGDHSYEGTLKYFKAFWEEGPDEMLFVLDDINWSSDMRRAWDEIKAYAPCYTLDFYKMGLVIKRPDFKSSLHKKIVPRVLKPWQLGFFS